MKNVLGMNGELVGLKELNSRVAEGYSPEQGLIGTREGVVMWIDTNLTETKEENELNGGELQEYIKLDNIKNLHGELMEDLEEGQEELICCKVDENDLALRAVTKCIFNNDTVYVYNYSRKPNGEIERLHTIADISMFQGLFVA